MKLGIVGGGVVGRATARCFMEHCDVRVYDVVRERATHDFHETLDVDLLMLCLPTPQKEGSLECDTSALDGFLAAHCQSSNACIAIRSTVPVGYTRKASEQFRLPNLVHSPEFLTARCALTDAQCPARNIVGVPHPGSPLFTGGNRGGEALNILYHQRFPGVPVQLMRSNESELVKLALNSFFAVKVAYFNEVYTLCQKLGLDFETVRAGVLSDGRVAHAHTAVPGPDGQLGFGGACLPKDLANFVSLLYALKLPMSVSYGAIDTNLTVRE